MSAAVLEVAGLDKSYGAVRAVNDLSFAVETGEVLGFLGPNGAGKTSTMRMILGLLKPDAGSIHLFGNPWSRDMLPRLGFRDGRSCNQPRNSHTSSGGPISCRKRSARSSRRLL